jgi:hypothetical protein
MLQEVLAVLLLMDIWETGENGWARVSKISLEKET